MTFPRTAVVAGLHSTVEAACRVHDQALGRMGCYHLFRLPPDIEDRLEQMAVTQIAPNALSAIASKEAALAHLAKIAEATITAPSGPVQVGVERRILTDTSIRELAAHYHSAFTQGIRCYPYFAAQTS